MRPSNTTGNPAEEQFVLRSAPVTYLAKTFDEPEGVRTNIGIGLETKGGSSGSPVFNAQGQVFGIVMGCAEGITSGFVVRTDARLDVVERSKNVEAQSLREHAQNRVTPLGKSGGAISAGPEGLLRLEASKATPHGDEIQLEGEGFDSNIGFWTQAEDYLSREVDVPSAGMYAIEVLSSCPHEVAGTPVAFEAGGKAVAFKVVGTGDFSTYERTPVGELHLPAGRSTVSLRAKVAPEFAVMNLRRIVLTPVKSGANK